MDTMTNTPKEPDAPDRPVDSPEGCGRSGDSLTPLGGAESDSGGILGTPVPGGVPEDEQKAPQEPVELSTDDSVARILLARDEYTRARESVSRSVQPGKDRPVWLRVWDHPMSPGTRYRLLQKRKRLEKRDREHYQTRRKKRREKYHKYQREGKLRRDKWLQTTPEGLYLYYKAIAHRRGLRWAITREDFLEVMNTEYNGTPIYSYLFSILRTDKSVGYTLENISVVDRYTKEVYYPPI